MGQLLFDGARHIVAQANIDAKRITQRSGNVRRAAESSLERFSQSLGNKKRLEAAGEQINAINENLGRNLDAASYGRLQQRLAASEELGAAAAEAAAAGIGGSSVETYNQTVRLLYGSAEEQGDRAVRTGQYIAGQQKGAVINDTLGSLGNDIFAPSLDFTQYVDDHKMGVFTKILTGAAAATATYFGGPQAGMAVINLATANQQANNGDFAGASSSLSSALGGIYSGIQTYRAGADDKHESGQAWGATVFKGPPKPSGPPPTWGEPGHEDQRMWVNPRPYGANLHI